MNHQLEQDYNYCRRIIQSHSKSFYYSFLQLPEDKANAVFAIYTFCRYADDSVDNATSTSEQFANLLQVEKELDLFVAGCEIDHPLWRALRDVFHRYDMELQPFYDQLTGQRKDIYFNQPQSIEQVEKYGYYVAGSVGLMLLPIIATRMHKYLQCAATRLGIAMQLTNILRDIGEDYQERGRVYLPKDLMEQKGYTESNIATSTINKDFIDIWEKLAERAERLYDLVLEEIQYFDEDSRLPVGLSAKVYRGILSSVRDNDYDCFHTRNYVSMAEMKRMKSEPLVSKRLC